MALSLASIAYEAHCGVEQSTGADRDSWRFVERQWDKLASKADVDALAEFQNGALQTQLRATNHHENRRAHSISMSSVSGSSPKHRTPQNEGQLRESITVKAKEADALVLQARIIMVNALDIKA
jgi:hypothetical protein